MTNEKLPLGSFHTTYDLITGDNAFGTRQYNRRALTLLLRDPTCGPVLVSKSILVRKPSKVDAAEDGSVILGYEALEEQELLSDTFRNGMEVGNNLRDVNFQELFG